MHDELHAARFVEEPLGNDALLGRDGAQNAYALFDVGDGLLCRVPAESFLFEPGNGPA